MGNSLKTISPVDGSVYVEREFATPALVEHAFRQAKTVSQSWQKVPVCERAKLCHKAIDIFIHKKENHCQRVVLANGAAHSLCGGGSERL